MARILESVRVVQIGSELMASYGGRPIVPTSHVPRPCPPELLHTVDDVIPLDRLAVQHTDSIPAYYGYSEDRTWQLEYALPAGLSRQDETIRHLRYIRNHTDSEALEYLKHLPHKVFRLHIHSTDHMSTDTRGDGTCCFQALRQAHIRAGTPVEERDNRAIDVPSFASAASRSGWVEWARSLLTPWHTQLDQYRITAFMEWLSTPDSSGWTWYAKTVNGGPLRWPSTGMAYDMGNTLPPICFFESCGRLSGDKVVYTFASSTIDKDHLLTGTALLQLVRESNYIGYSPEHFYMLPSTPGEDLKIMECLCQMVSAIRLQDTSGHDPGWILPDGLRSSPPAPRMRLPVPPAVSALDSQSALLRFPATVFYPIADRVDMGIIFSAQRASRIGSDDEPGWRRIMTRAATYGLTTLDVHGNGQCFLLAAQYCLLRAGWSLEEIPSVTDIRANVMAFLVPNRDTPLPSGLTLDVIRESLRNLHSTVPTLYDTWESWCAGMSLPKTYCDMVFLYGFTHVYEVALRLIREIESEDCIYHMDEVPPPTLITMGFHCSGLHFVPAVPLGHVDELQAMDIVPSVEMALSRQRIASQKYNHKKKMTKKDRQQARQFRMMQGASPSEEAPLPGEIVPCPCAPLGSRDPVRSLTVHPFKRKLQHAAAMPSEQEPSTTEKFKRPRKSKTVIPEPVVVQPPKMTDFFTKKRPLPPLPTEDTVRKKACIEEMSAVDIDSPMSLVNLSTLDTLPALMPPPVIPLSANVSCSCSIFILGTCSICNLSHDDKGDGVPPISDG